MMKYQLSFVLLLTPLVAKSGLVSYKGHFPKRAVLSVSVRRSSWLKVRTMETTSPGQESFKNALMICKPKTYSSICTMAVQPG